MRITMGQRHNLLREYRERCAISTAEMAQKLGIAESTLRSLENGNRTITAELCRNIEVVTKGAVTRADIDPAIFGQAA